MNDSSQKPIMASSNQHSSTKLLTSNHTDWRANYSGSSSLSSFSYSPRSNNSSVSSGSKKQTQQQKQQNGSLRSNNSTAEKNSVEEESQQ
jgi:hypothetical protein